MLRGESGGPLRRSRADGYNLKPKCLPQPFDIGASDRSSTDKRNARLGHRHCELANCSAGQKLYRAVRP